MSQEGGDPGLMKLDNFEGDLEEHWRDARGRKVLDRNGDEVGTVEELYVWAGPSTVHLLRVGGAHRFLLPVQAVTNVDEEGVKVEIGRDKIMASPEFDSEDVPDHEARRAAHDHYGYPDPLDLGG